MSKSYQRFVRPAKKSQKEKFREIERLLGTFLFLDHQRREKLRLVKLRLVL